MKHFRYLLTMTIALLTGSAVAQAETVRDYVMNFDKSIDTSGHDFKVASGWGHLVGFYQGSYTKYYVEYDWQSDGGRTGGALACGQQGEVGSYYDNGTTTDLLVTPKVRGDVSIYVKKNGYTATGIKFYKLTEENGQYTVGDEITPLAEPTYSYSDWCKVELPTQEEEGSIGIWASSVLIDDFCASEADIVKMSGLLVKSVVNNGGDRPFCNEQGRFTVNYTATIQNVGDIDLEPGQDNYTLSVVNKNDDNKVMFTIPVTQSLPVDATTTVDLVGEVDGNAYPNYNRYDVMENFNHTVQYGSFLTPVPYKPILEVRADNALISPGKAMAYGMINKSVTKTIGLRNAGGAPINDLTVTAPDGFTTNITAPQTLGAGEELALELTADASTPRRRALSAATW